MYEHRFITDAHRFDIPVVDVCVWAPWRREAPPPDPDDDGLIRDATPAREAEAR